MHRIKLLIIAALLLLPLAANAASYNIEVVWTPTGDADVAVHVLCDVNAAPVTSRGKASDPAGQLAFTLTADGGESLRCVSQGQRVSTNQWGALSPEVSVTVPLPRPGQYPITIRINVN